MTHAQIGAAPHKACCHTTNKPGCHICANYAAVLDADKRLGCTVQTAGKP